MNMLKHSMASLFLVSIIGCGANDGTAESGTLRMELSSTVGDRVYELRGANFVVRGNGVGDRWLNGDNVERIEEDLPPGAYTVTLQDFWRIERTANGVTQNVAAVLTSENPLGFTITLNEVTPVVYTFEAGDGVIPFGNGRLHIGVQITENDGNPSCSDNPCGVGFECRDGDCLALDGTACEVNTDCLGGICTTFFADSDGDGFGATASGTRRACGAALSGSQWVTNALDCCDTNAAVNPSYSGGPTTMAAATCGAPFDWNCDGVATPQFSTSTCSQFPASQCPPVVFPNGAACGQAAAASACAVVDGLCASVRGALITQACY